MIVGYTTKIDFTTGTIDSMIDQLIAIKNTHGKDIYIKYDYMYSYDDNRSYYYEVMRPETDEEMNKRIRIEEDQKERQKIREIETLKALKLKYKDVS